MIFDEQVEQWRARVDELKFDDMPTDGLLAWIAEESGGNPCATGIIDGGRNVEAGIGQQYFETPDANVGGVTSTDLRSACGANPHNAKPLRPLTEDEEINQVSALVTDAARSLATARSQLKRISVVWTEPEVWCLAKLQHGLPAISSMLLLPAKTSDAVDTWRAWWRWIAQLDERSVEHLAPPVARFGYHRNPDGTLAWVGLGRFALNAERVGCAVGPLP